MTVIRRPFASASREFNKSRERSRKHLEAFLGYIRTPEITYLVELDPYFKHSISCFASVVKAAISYMTIKCESVQECLFVVDFWRQHSEAYSYHPKYRLTRNCYDSLLHRLSKFGLAGEMKRLYTDMLELRVSPGVHTYNHMISIITL